MPTILSLFIAVSSARRPPAEFVSATVGPILSASTAAASVSSCAFAIVSNS